MTFDELQQTWQSQEGDALPRVDADLLLKEMQRNQRDFRGTILRRDVLEVGVGLVLLPFWIYKGLTSSMPWTWWLGVPAIVFVVGYFLVDRMCYPQTASDHGEPLLKCVKNSLAQVEHQIWLLSNVFWWYLMPFTIAIAAFFGQTTLQRSDDWLEALGLGCSSFGFLIGVYGFIDYINQRAVCFDLEPRRQELLALIKSLGGEDSTETQSPSTGAKCVDISRILRRWIIVAIVCFVPLFVLALAGGGLGGDQRTGAGYPKLSPFAAVRWQDSQPEVEVGNEWFNLISVDNVSAADIVAFSQKTYGDKWRKRFEEDLVEVLAGMGHEPKDTVQLVMSPLGSSEKRTFKDVPMTKANRQAIRAAAEKTEPSTALPVVRVAPEVLKTYEGAYAITPQFVMTVTVEDEKLMLQATGQGKLEFFPESATKFFCRAVDAKITFVRDDSGKFSRLILHQNGANQVAQRRD